MKPFQVKETIFVCDDAYFGFPRQYVLDNSITFGDLDDLMFRRQDLRFGFNQRRRFHPGNYVFSKLLNDDSNLSLVIHHENVDPKAILEKLHEKSTEMATKPTDVEEKKMNAAIDEDKKSLIGSSDWLKKENKSCDDTSTVGWAALPYHERCDICDGSSFDHPPPARSIVDYYVMHKIYDARIQLGDSPDEARSKASKYLDLVFVVNDWYWMEKKTEWKLTPIDDGKTYQVEFQDGEKIGYAFDMKQDFGDENIRGVLLQYSIDRSTATAPFALVLETETANMLRPEAFVHPMSDFFYASEYRRFIVNGQKQISPYFGVRDDQSPFSNLPPNLFVKIVSYLSLKERVLVRRVNTSWRKISNDVLAVGTKQIDLVRNDMIEDWTNADLNRMIPLVAGGLESMRLPYLMRPGPDFEFIRPEVSFRSLREIDICDFTLDYNLATILMEMAPGLKKFAGNMHLDVQTVDDQRCFKSVEELVLGRYGCDSAINMGDSYLMALIDLFPNIRRLSLHNLRFVSASAASTMAERLGPKLERLEMRFDGTDTWDEELWSIVRAEFIPPLGVFDGICSCVSLKSLALINSQYISIGFTQALANGCPQLETLDLSGSLLPNGSSAPLEKLAALTSLTKLNVSNIEGVSDGLMAVVREGRLEQLLLRDSRPSAELIKACFRYCTGVLLLDVHGDEFTPSEVIDIVSLYGRYGRTRRTVVRAVHYVWSLAQVDELQMAIKNGDHPHHQGLFVIDMTYYSHGFVENAAEEYETADPNELLLEQDEC